MSAIAAVLRVSRLNLLGIAMTIANPALDTTLPTDRAATSGVRRLMQDHATAFDVSNGDAIFESDLEQRA